MSSKSPETESRESYAPSDEVDISRHASTDDAEHIDEGLLPKSVSLQEQHSGTEPRDQLQRVAHAQSQTARHRRRRHDKRYRDLLDDTIQGACGCSPAMSEPLPASKIGASLWTSVEKEKFFLQLNKFGIDDLPALAHAIGSKEVIEIRRYLLFLDENAKAQARDPEYGETLSLADVPSSWEIGKECEDLLDGYAEACARTAEAQDIEQERQRYGESWLIDEAFCMSMESSAEPTAPKSSSTFPEHEYEDIDNEEEENKRFGEDLIASEHEKRSTKEAEAPANPFHLLRPLSFVQLSQLFFMNGLPNDDANSGNLLHPKLDNDGPAIFRSAFDELYSLTLEVTHRLVTASVFQGVSRLRAKDHEHPKPEINSSDVSIAAELLGLHGNLEKYWAGIARRCDLKVYTSSDRYTDGRAGTKNGVALTFDEVETELGFPPDRKELHVFRATTEEGEDRSQEDETEGEEDLVSVVDSESATSEGGLKLEEHLSSESDQMPAYENEETAAARPSKRRRRSGPSKTEDDEDSECNFVDQQSSREEELRIFDMLRKTPPPALKRAAAFSPRDALPRKKTFISRWPPWRDDIRYEAEWEQNVGLDGAFDMPPENAQDIQ